MERILHYEIKASDDSPTVACFLKRQGYSSANLTDLKKMPESILINGTPAYMIRHLQGGDRLTVHIQETAVSEKIPPVYHPLDIVYEDEDLLVINKPADLNNFKRKQSVAGIAACTGRASVMTFPNIPGRNSGSEQNIIREIEARTTRSGRI